MKLYTNDLKINDIVIDNWRCFIVTDIVKLGNSWIDVCHVTSDDDMRNPFRSYTGHPDNPDDRGEELWSVVILRGDKVFTNVPK